MLDNTVQLTDFDEIERELKTLPTDLNDAYVVPFHIIVASTIQD